ncbi:hypothetical protein COCSUDRAFT_83518 [Coccomyxa subellipsoidea C-169]|uniref:Anaphase-promoting complex subunit 5 n=1 Tax=Coccomyxa subellipsoidea (strain C-169) TaxID=574566 RepID=I0YSC5_COCSC|nr:hypothetical protein COCSUDRAFT_83518 [Coccomyxa subellipsoidea C-169]EIE21294.1 hypothetical protein COCSUDRAFT_83518 [Coccomyxa subellipsoidea C-169]|eukprot:XP_005645838.1 hypothetical protein COCSUDRAFT_83518 [Coccomyxa subellipsoidea C-169]
MKVRISGKAGASATGRHQSALLSLGAVHTQLGHVQEATLALNEALHIAQQINDHVALAHTLATLTSLLDSASPELAPAVQETRGLPGPHTKHLQLLRLLRRCEKRGVDLQLPHIVAYARLALAKFALLHHPQASKTDGLSARGALIEGPPPGGPAAANVPRPAIADLYSAGPTVFDATAKESQAASASAVEAMAGSAQLLKAAAFERCGAPGLARTAALARLAAEPAGPGDAEERCIAYAQLATHAADHLGFGAAAQVLEVADTEFPDAQSRPLAMARLGIAHQRSLAHRDIISARQLGAAMSALAEPEDAVLLNLRCAHTATAAFFFWVTST